MALNNCEIGTSKGTTKYNFGKHFQYRGIFSVRPLGTQFGVAVADRLLLWQSLAVGTIDREPAQLRVTHGRSVLHTSATLLRALFEWKRK